MLKMKDNIYNRNTMFIREYYKQGQGNELDNSEGTEKVSRNVLSTKSESEGSLNEMHEESEA